MNGNLSFWALIANADPIVQFIMFILLICSIWTWSIIVQRYMIIKKAKQELKSFLTAFWAGSDMTKLYSSVTAKNHKTSGASNLFSNGFKSFMRLRKNSKVNRADMMDGVERSMRVTMSREVDSLENQLALLATIGSVAPYIGLLGTVWGIMGSFSALGTTEHATLALVAPHIAEALIATALGLFVAIPAVVAYNRYTRAVESVVLEYENFQDEFCSILHREAP
jgi:biopolymer transport protein TolQ